MLTSATAQDRFGQRYGEVMRPNQEATGLGSPPSPESHSAQGFMLASPRTVEGYLMFESSAAGWGL